MRRFGIAGLALAAGLVTAAAQDMKSPRISYADVDWDAVGADLGAIEALNPAATIVERLAELNRATGRRFANMAASPVPVLLPFDAAAYLRDHADGSANPAASSYLMGFQATPFFYPGPGGYDAVVLARAQEMRELGVGYSEPIYVHIAGSALTYELAEPAGMIGWPVTGGLEADVPGIRRLFLENYVRYTFVRYGVPYVVSIECFDGGARFRKISCRDADKVAVRLIKALRLAGGMPQQRPESIEADTIERPAAMSTVFTYHSPGSLLAGTGFKGKTGVADYTVYSKIRFPMADAPAFANSQAFMNWGNCEATGRLGAGMLGRVAAYRCRVNGQPLISDESAAANYSYPWRDNFCEHRFFFVGQCPGGLGHQGQDIRPASCKQRMPGANRCEPYQHDVVAVRDGAVLRAAGQESLYLVVNAANERVRFRYLHMLPRQFDADGMVSGRFVREGEVIGKVGNYFKRERGTTYHLHFDAQVPTKYGWVFVNPYMTLVAAYERLIHGRGQEIHEDTTMSVRMAAPAGTIRLSDPMFAAAKPAEIHVESPPTETADSEAARDERTDQPFPVTASVPADAGGSDGVGMEPNSTGSTGDALRAVGRGFSRAGARTWHLRRHLHTGDEQPQTRHSGL